MTPFKCPKFCCNVHPTYAQILHTSVPDAWASYVHEAFEKGNNEDNLSFLDDPIVYCTLCTNNIHTLPNGTI